MERNFLDPSRLPARSSHSGRVASSSLSSRLTVSICSETALIEKTIVPPLHGNHVDGNVGTGRFWAFCAPGRSILATPAAQIHLRQEVNYAFTEASRRVPLPMLPTTARIGNTKPGADRCQNRCMKWSCRKSSKFSLQCRRTPFWRMQGSLPETPSHPTQVGSLTGE